MGTLIYTGITSLDGYVNDAHGNFDWAAPCEEVHAFVNDLERGVATYLYGRRMYDTMTYWETIERVFDPVVVGDGTPFLPDGYSERLDLLDEQRFENGVVYLRYAVA